MSGNQQPFRPPPGYSHSNKRGYAGITQAHYDDPQAGQEAAYIPDTTMPPYGEFDPTSTGPYPTLATLHAGLAQQDRHYSATPHVNQPTHLQHASHPLVNNGMVMQRDPSLIPTGPRFPNPVPPPRPRFIDQRQYEGETFTNMNGIAVQSPESEMSRYHQQVAGRPDRQAQHAANGHRYQFDGSQRPFPSSMPGNAEPYGQNQQSSWSDRDFNPREGKRPREEEETSEMGSVQSSPTQAPPSIKRRKTKPAQSTPSQAPPTQAKTKGRRPKLDLRTFAPAKSSRHAANAIQNSAISHATIQNATVYPDAATAFQAAKDRLDRTSSSIKFYKLKIRSDDHKVFTHQELMPKLCQRFFDAILKAPGAPPDYIIAADLPEWNKKHADNYQTCIDLMSTEELRLDAQARIELLVAATMQLSTHGIPMADLKVSDFNKAGDKQKIKTWGEYVVDLESTFLERLDRMVQYCAICKLMAIDILQGVNTRDIAAAPDRYATRKFTNFNSNGGRNSRKKHVDEVNAKIAELEGGGDDD